MPHAALLGLWMAAFPPGAAPVEAAAAAVTYWQERACAPQRRWCVPWVRLDGERMEVACEWRDPWAATASLEGNPKLYLLDPSGQRYDHTATSGAAAYGMSALERGEVVKGSFFFPRPGAGVHRFTLHDDERGLTVSGIELALARSSSADVSHRVLGRLADADTITISRAAVGWGGSTEQSILLSRAGDGFAGELRSDDLPWRRHRPSPSPPAAPRALRLSAREAALFLDTLAESALFHGEYRPAMFYLDHYPSTRIDVAVKGATISFASESQGEDQVPWQVTVDGRSWIVPSAHPARALRLVEAIAQGDPPPGPGPEEDREPQPLRMAAQLGQVERVRQLLARGAAPERRTAYDGESALTAAARWGQAGSVGALLDGGADPVRPNAAGKSALFLAASGGHTEVVKVLLGRGARASASGALAAAAGAGSLESVRALLAAGRAPRPELGRALVEAALHGSTEMLRALLDAGAPLDGAVPMAAHPTEGPLPLEAAIKQGHLEAVRLLIAAGADVGARAGRWPPLRQAAYVGYVDLVELLLRSGASPKATDSTNGSTALFGVTVPAVAAALLRAGADPNARSRRGATPLVYLAEYNWTAHYYGSRPHRERPPPDYLGTARVLLDGGADVDAYDSQGLTALQTAAAHLLTEHNPSLAVLLLERGSDPDRRDAQGRTPLWLAMSYRLEYPESPSLPQVTALIQALVKAGARNLPDAGGVTPLDLAKRSGDPALLELLRAAPGGP
jgi:ankyrin repeat protein